MTISVFWNCQVFPDSVENDFYKWESFYERNTNVTQWLLCMIQPVQIDSRDSSHDKKSSHLDDGLDYPNFKRVILFRRPDSDLDYN